MADVYGVAVTPTETVLTAGTARTVLQLVAASNHRVKLYKWAVSFDGTSTTAEPVFVYVVRQTSAGTMTALTCQQKVPTSETIQTTARYAATAEPTVDSPAQIIEAHEVHPQTGLVILYADAEAIRVAGGARIGIICVAPAGVNCIASMDFEE